MGNRDGEWLRKIWERCWMGRVHGQVGGVEGECV